ncbi:protein translocase subunit SecF [Glutamicibacter halophytocola]|uniref:Protein-export membrane protein SecF n=1 Tax=Glutamicibacter halophytocola TaxID=1933880 RepID=A0A5B8IIE0_9MICC|nr:protein translocase subunit SecF [Glutamicibacter halophytocola]ALG29093.1 preprotein translocase subunit SecF [Glutamicibacter halophytocola]NQD39668.1 protein translocase subunit SecF [Glutamicibacter halophytocola]QDY65354.1 protein translocase subunit SecF [Glutamicibacter halophytocola]UUX57442.1 protein translocase subunit SecF [Glutamicibacter halophytocola]
MNKLVTWGNELYTGKRSYPFTSKHRLWFAIAGAMVILSILVPVVKGGFNLGIDFRGGSEFTVSDVQNTDIKIGEHAVTSVASGAEATVTNIAPNTMRVQTERLSDDETLAIAASLAEDYGVSSDEVTSNFIGPTWGQDVSRQALLGLFAFVVLVGLLMAAYFRTWKMSLAAIVGLLVVIFVTAGIYSVTGFEITPSAIIGFLTILSYSLYDTVVVFDKVRENTKDFTKQSKRTFEQLVNLAVNQTLVRSINTSVVAVLPVASILFIGSYMLGAGTLKDLSLALFVGIIISALSTLFVQAPLYQWLRRNDSDVVEHSKKMAVA